MHKVESGLLPKQNEIESILALNWGGEVAEVMDSYLLNPLREFLDRPSKKIRGRMVEIGFRLAATGDVDQEFLRNQRWIESAGNLLESLHSASLIIDDIQDNSHERRGEPTRSSKTWNAPRAECRELALLLATTKHRRMGCRRFS